MMMIRHRTSKTEAGEQQNGHDNKNDDERARAAQRQERRAEARRKKAKNNGNGKKLVRIVSVFAGILLLIYLAKHYVRSRRLDPFGGPLVLRRQSLLTPEQDMLLEWDAKNDNVRYHMIFSTDCSPYQHWQSYLVYYTAMRVHQPGHVTRIASGCNPQEQAAMTAWFVSEVSYMSKRFHVQFTPHFSGVKNAAGDTVGDYKFFNKPFGLLYWMEHAPELQYSETYKSFPEAVRNDVVILIDPDMALLRPITVDFSNDRETLIGKRRQSHVLASKVGPGKPFAQVYGFGTQWSKLDLAKIAGEDSPALQVSQEDGGLYYPVGPPYLATVTDMYAIAQKWTEFVPETHAQYPHLLAEMFAYCIAAAHLQLPHQLIDSLMISKDDIGGGEGWPLVDEIPRAEVCEFASDPDHVEYPVPSVVHYCQRYAVGKDWFFSKRKIPSDIYDCDTPLFQEPPEDLVVAYDYKQPPGAKEKTTMSKQLVQRNAFMLCYLYSLVNQAATFYKRNACPAGKPNLQKTRNLVAYLHEQQHQQQQHQHQSKKTE